MISVDYDRSISSFMGSAAEYILINIVFEKQFTGYDSLLNNAGKISIANTHVSQHEITQRTRKHSSRMCTSHLPTIHVQWPPLDVSSSGGVVGP